MNKIIYLLKNDEKEIKMLFKSLELLNKNFIPDNNYPVYIIHDEHINDDIFEEMKKFSGLDFKTILISFESDEYKNKTINAPDKIKVFGVEREFGIGYRHMCRFYSYGMYLLEELKDTNYYLRLDCDSYFIDKVNYDIFKYMEDGSYIYGYNNITTDNPVVCENLWEFSKEYSKNVNVLKTPIDEIRQYNIYYTNFEIAKFNWFTNSEYKYFFNFLDEKNGIYLNRWGDACIKYLGIEMFVPDNKKCHINLPYLHGNIFNI